MSRVNKRPSFVVRLAFTLVLLTAVAGCWRQPGFGPLHQGWNRTETGITADNVDTLELSWSSEVEDGAVRSDPVVSGPGLVHVSDDLAAYGLRITDGGRVWRTGVVPTELQVPGRTGMVSADETRVYVPWGGVPDDGGASELDATTGAVLRTVGRTPGPESFTVRGPWRVGNVSGFVEMTLAFSGVSVEGPTPWFVLTELQVLADLRGPTPAAVTSTRFFVGIDQGFHGSNVLSGWDLDRACESTRPDLCPADVRVQLDGLPVAPVVSDDESTVFVATDAGTVYAVDTADGAIRWTASLGAPVVHRMAWTSSTLYAVTGDGDLVALDAGGCGAATCRPRWTTELAGAPVLPPAVAGELVYVPSVGGVVEAFGPTGGEALWTEAVGSDITGGPVVAHGAVLLGTADGHVLAYRPA